MQDIAELERRITAALERIARGLDRTPESAAPAGPGIGGSDLAVPAVGGLAGATPDLAEPEPAVTAAPDLPDSAAELAVLTEALDEERMANAQLSERLKVVRNKEARLRRGLEDQIADLVRQLDAQGLELGRAHGTMVQQGGQLRALREAVEAQVADPALINRTMQVELEALRATRGAEVAELDVILAALDPLIAKAPAAKAPPMNAPHSKQGAADAGT